MNVNGSGNQQNLFALSSASKMGQKGNTTKIPRGATGVMPGKAVNDADKAKKQIVGFKEKAKEESNTENNPDEPEDKEYEVEVTEPPPQQLQELEEVDDSKMHPVMRRDAPTTDINIEHLTPEMDKQRRRESVVLDEDGEEYKQIHQEREERIRREELRREQAAKVPMPDTYRCSLSTGVYGFYALNDAEAVEDEAEIDEASDLEEEMTTYDGDAKVAMPDTYRCSLSTGVYGFYTLKQADAVDATVQIQLAENVINADDTDTMNGMPDTYRSSLSTGVYGFYMIRHNT